MLPGAIMDGTKETIPRTLLVESAMLVAVTVTLVEEVMIDGAI